ncbi:DUF6082 family protein [Streptomyces sp. MBT49]|uniref:DUF6082 family protein n=1 Tax=Streptomyces sp. MBT49 TaxID=1488380 RepID=UPI001F20CA19|nr:DUF6082 family protein [Streptomyces sp. MBT49]
MLSKAIADPELTEVLDLFEAPVSTKQHRQYLCTKALYTKVLFATESATYPAKSYSCGLGTIRRLPLSELRVGNEVPVGDHHGRLAPNKTGARP